MAVRALNIKTAPKFDPIAELERMDSPEGRQHDHTAAVIAALLDNNRGEASRAFARARLAGCDLATIQARCFDANVSGALLRQAYTLSKEHTAESLSRANAAVSALESGVKEERKAMRSERLRAPMFTGLALSR